MRFNYISVCLALIFILTDIRAEDGLAAWLRYAPPPNAQQLQKYVPSKIAVLNGTVASPVYSAGNELKQGIESILGRSNVASTTSHLSKKNIIIVGTLDQFTKAYGKIASKIQLEGDAFWLKYDASLNSVYIIGADQRGALYGAFEYLRLLALGSDVSKLNVVRTPAGPIRWVNQWDNMDGDITREYGGDSIFFSNGTISQNLTRAGQFARILSSIGINSCVVNNVNANSTLLSPSNIQDLARIANVFRPWGVQLSMSIDFAAPQDFGGLSTYDPVDPSVVGWWDSKIKELYTAIPDMGGFLIKADSEGQAGPAQYNRTLAQGANIFADALAPFNGIVMYRAFVYNQLNESDLKADRANAAVQFFQPFDGQFRDNVVVQIKNGPIDFQVREPTSPLFGVLQKTNVAMEVEVAQEYLGQQCHLVYLPPLWKETLDFDLQVDNKPSTVKDIISGKRFNRTLGGMAAVTNVGLNSTWLGSHLAMSNLYGYGRLAWDADSSSEEIIQDWTRLTFGHDQKVIQVIQDMSMQSWPAYENYSGNLGIQTLTDILYTHFGPNPQTADGNGWGQWTRTDKYGLGMDRSVSTGTGFAGQYPSKVASMYESIETTPDELALWFHHLSYTHKLHSGKTVIQHFYDAHYEGAQTAAQFVSMWKSLNGKIDAERFEDVLERQVYQAGHSIVWRDSIVNYFYNWSGIPDAHGRVGHHPYRIEAESMELEGYAPYKVSPFEAASNFTAITVNNTVGTATATLKYPDGIYDLAVQYYDLYGGTSHYEIYLNKNLIGSFYSNTTMGHTPSIYLDGISATRHTFHSVHIKLGDTLRIVGTPDENEPAPLDYVAILPPGILD
ncbi:hypothetical protein NQZ79_g6235 [Umbelopsis isabellina]|nr:hypothetical protein NQZ79_g6235 [Umbelopsis isabellina]